MSDEIPDTRVHPSSADGYVPPADPLVRAKLERWQDLKFGLLMHWGLYALRGVVESWGLCPEDQPWCDRGGVPWADYVRDYHALIREFDPHAFDPGPWADAARDAGMGYVVFTTKHHDGFALFDTRLSEHRVTGPACPHRTHPRADVTRAVFDAFRERGLWTGAYFSKPDWRHADYWAPEFPVTSRSANYDTRQHPERWQRFRDFTYGQIEELMTRYGDIDVLWLDGGWVRPRDTITDDVRSWGYPIPDDEQSVDMPRIAAMARRRQPGLLIADRTVHGPHEDYTTPEQRVPDTHLPHPWESNLTMTHAWGWVPEPEYKSARTLIHTLVDVVAKGGNLLLNVGPTPRGTWDDEAYDRLREIGAWMRVNGEAIHGTRPVAPYLDGDVRFTGKGDRVFAIHLGADAPPSRISFSGIAPPEGSTVRWLETDEPIPWAREAGRTILHVDERLRSAARSRHAWTVSFDSERP